MKKLVLASVMALASLSLVFAPMLRAQDSITIKDPAEFNSYQTASQQSDPTAKAAALESFLETYPQSVVKTAVLDQLIDTYQGLGDADKTLSAAKMCIRDSSIRDNVRAQAKLLDSLGVRRLRLVLGGSIGGMQALDWAIYDPERVQRAVIIGVAPLSAMGLALNHLQRQAIQHDPEWKGGHYLPQRQPRKGLALARQIGMISYKSARCV